MSSIYSRIEELCRNKGVTVTQLCRDCSISRASLTDYKKGRIKSLSTGTLTKIAGYFGVSIDHICGRRAPGADEMDLKVALFGGDGEITDGMLEEVLRYARYIKERENGDK